MTSKKLVAVLGGLLYQAGLLVLSAYKPVPVEALDKGQLIGAAVTLAALGVQTWLDFLKVKNGAPSS